MKVYRELYLCGTNEQLKNYINKIRNFHFKGWTLEDNKNNKWSKYLIFDYSGKAVNKAKVFIYIGNLDNENIHVGNIIPTEPEKSELTIDEYNDILDLFYNDIINKITDEDIEIQYSKNDEFNPLSILSKESLEKLEVFCNAANKTTGSHHPCDRERWFDFIFYSFTRNEIFSEETLAKFLSDKEYWDELGINKTMEGAWTEDAAYKLAQEYSLVIETLDRYKKWRNN